ncbi:MAG: recombination protein RecR [Melioribacteraceae bacterium]|nr:MAG: recombination protein RecR [Melioribacteraceae bacterium]
MQIAEPLQRAIDELNKLPTIGRKTALRLALYILKSKEENVTTLTNALLALKTDLRFCNTCHNISIDEECEICKSTRRDKSVLCVVEEPSDVIAIEKSNEFNGVYHVLGGVLSPLSGKGTDDLNIDSLVKRVEHSDIRELILALNPDTEGETTALYLARLFKNSNLNISRIARGLPVGGDLEFADQATIGRAFIGRIKVE